VVIGVVVFGVVVIGVMAVGVLVGAVVSVPHPTRAATAANAAAQRRPLRGNLTDDTTMSARDATRRKPLWRLTVGRIDAVDSDLRYCQGAITEEEVSAAAVNNEKD
jgi:hypothetical protein